MKFIQSFWSKPFFDDTEKNNWNYRHFGGFHSSFLFYCSWTYSCLSIKKQYPNLHLVTDDRGIEIFKEALDLPYTSFSNDLNDLDNYNTKLWALGKLYTYKLQKNTPFCHIDGDVFLFDKVLDPILKSPVFYQSYDFDADQYHEIHEYIHQNFDNVPSEYHCDLSEKMKFINAGVIGGNNSDIFQRYTAKAFELIENNTSKLEDINQGLLNLYYEQFLLSNMVAKENIETASLFPKPNDDHNHNFAAFHQIPHGTTYVHLLSHLKKSTEFMEQVVVRLQLEYPDYYTRVVTFHQKNNS